MNQIVEAMNRLSEAYSQVMLTNKAWDEAFAEFKSVIEQDGEQTDQLTFLDAIKNCATVNIIGNDKRRVKLVSCGLGMNNVVCMQTIEAGSSITRDSDMMYVKNFIVHPDIKRYNLTATDPFGESFLVRVELVDEVEGDPTTLRELFERRAEHIELHIGADHMRVLAAEFDAETHTVHVVPSIQGRNFSFVDAEIDITAGQWNMVAKEEDGDRSFVASIVYNEPASSAGEPSDEH